MKKTLYTRLKRMAALVLAAALVVIVLPPLSVSAATTYSGGSGTAQDPYLIATCADLDNVDRNPDKHFRQICDIDMRGIDFVPLMVLRGSYDGGGNCRHQLRHRDQHEEYRVGLRQQYPLSGRIFLRRLCRRHCGLQ